MGVIPDYWNINSTTNEDLLATFDKLYWKPLDHKAIAERTAKLIEETKELHEAMLEYELGTQDLKGTMQATNEMMWELSDVFAVFRHIEGLILDEFGLKRDQLDWLEQKLAGMAVHKAEMRKQDPNWGRKR